MINKLMAKHGYKLVEENKYHASYERYNDICDYTQTIDILHKSNGIPIIQSYDHNDFDIVVGIEYKILPLLYLKALKIKWRFRK